MFSPFQNQLFTIWSGKVGQLCQWPARHPWSWSLSASSQQQPWHPQSTSEKIKHLSNKWQDRAKNWQWGKKLNFKYTEERNSETWRTEMKKNMLLMVVFSCSRHQNFCEMSSKPMNAQNAIPPYPQRFLVGVNCQDGNIEIRVPSMNSNPRYPRAPTS